VGQADQRAVTGRLRITRPELTASMVSSLLAGSLLLIAGAGFGKTTAVELALDDLDWPFARLSCTSESRDAGRLLSAIVASLQLAAPGLVDVIADLLGGALGPIDVASTTTALIAELDSLLVDPVAIFLDDAEAIADSPDALAVVGALVSLPSERVHVALASRRPLRLHDAKQRATGRLTELGERELAFSEEECADYLRERHGRAPDPDDVDSIFAATRGWPLGVAVNARNSAPAPGSGDLEEFFDFLDQEVLDTIEEPLRGALIDSSAVPVLDPALESALGLPSGFGNRVRGLGVFAEPVGAGEGRWRYHPLFREFLLTRLRAERTQDEVADLCERAADAERDAGRPAEAVRLLLEASRYDKAAAVIAECGQGYMRTSWRAVRGWLGALPEDLRQTPPIQLLEGQVLLAEGDQPRAEAVLTDAMHGFAQAGVVPGEWMARWLRVASLHEMADWETIGELAEGFDESVIEAAGLPAVALGLYGIAAKANRGDIDGAEAMIERVMSHPHANMAASIYAQTRPFIDVPAGRIDQTLEQALSMVGQVERHDPLGTLPLVLGTIALLRYEQGYEAEALSYWDRIAGEVDRLGAHRAVAPHAHMQRAILLARAGRVAEAERAFAAAGGTRMKGFRESWEFQARAAISWQRGDAARALAECERAYELLREVPTTADRSWMMIVIVPILMDVGAAPRALEYVDDTLAFWNAVLPGDHGRFWYGRTLADRAWIRHAEGDVDGGVEDIRQAWVKLRHVEAHVVRTRWPRLRPVLWDAVDKGALEPGAIVEAVRAAVPAGDAMADFLAHPRAEVRRAALGPAAASGHPRAIGQLKALADGGGAEAGAATRALDRLREGPPALAFGMLGGFRLRRGEWEVDAASWARPAASALVRFLLVHRAEAVPEDDLFAAFWPSRSEKTARSSLQVALSQARSVLDVPGSPQSKIASVHRTYRLNLSEHDRVDTEEFAAAAQNALRLRGADRVDALEQAASLWIGEPLPEDRYAVWASAWRDDLNDRYAGLLSALVRARLRAGDNLEAVTAARKLIDLDPLNEASHSDLMIAYARAGRRSNALRQYLVCRRALVDGLGVEPSEAIAGLHARVLAGERV
jgi:DNA-binding SARP family transcriptional activator